MSKRPRKTAGRGASKVGSGRSASAAAKRPSSSPKDGAERIARALESIAAHLSAGSPAPDALDSFAAAEAFVWHHNGRLAPVPRVSRVDLGLLKGLDRMRGILLEGHGTVVMD